MDPTQIKNIRQTLGITQEQLAAIIGVTKTTVGRYEIGQAKPSGNPAKKLAQLDNVCNDAEQLAVVKDLIIKKKSDGLAAIASALAMGAALIPLAGIVAGGIGVVNLLKGTAGKVLYQLLQKYQADEGNEVKKAARPSRRKPKGSDPK